MIIGLDVGNSRVKLVSNGYRDSFQAIIGEGGDLKLDHHWGADNMDVLWRGKRYFVGPVATYQSDGAGRVRTESKAHNHTLLLALCALHRAVEDGAHVELVTGTPISQHKASEKDLMRGLLLGKQLISVNGQPKEFHIDAVSTVPETASAYFAIPRQPRSYILDCGSRTTGYAEIWRNNFINPKSGTLPYGLESFNGSQSAYVQAVVSDISRIWPDDAHITLIGGAADILLPMFEEWLHSRIKATDDALFVNANAYYVLGVQRYDKAKMQAR